MDDTSSRSGKEINTPTASPACLARHVRTTIIIMMMMMMIIIIIIIIIIHVLNLLYESNFFVVNVGFSSVCARACALS